MWPSGFLEIRGGNLRGGPLFPSQQGPGGYGSVWEGCWSLWVCGFATQAGLLPAGIQRRAWRPGAAPGSTWATQPLPGACSFPAIHKRLSSLRLYLALCCFFRAEKACWVPVLMRTCAVGLANNAARRWCGPEAWGFPGLVRGMESELVPGMLGFES